MSDSIALIPTCCLFVIFFLGYFEQQITGFGATLFCLPFAMFFIDKGVFTPIAWAFTLAQAAYIFVRQRNHVNIKQLFISLVLASTFGTIISNLLLESFPEKCIKLGLAIFIVLNSSVEIHRIVTDAKRKPLKPRHYFYPVGSGALQASFGIGGPLLVAYLTKVIDDKDELRSTLSGYWVFLNGFLLINCALTRGIPIESVRLGGVLLPAVLLGIILGSLVVKKVNHKTFSLLVHVVLIISSGLMLI